MAYPITKCTKGTDVYPGANSSKPPPVKSPTAQPNGGADNLGRLADVNFKKSPSDLELLRDTNRNLLGYGKFSFSLIFRNVMVFN